MGKVFFIKTGILAYQGEFKNNKISGKGILYDQNGIILIMEACK